MIFREHEFFRVSFFDKVIFALFVILLLLGLKELLDIIQWCFEHIKLDIV